METLAFEWDNNKNEINIKKHAIDFNEACTVFYDDYAIMIPDIDHSETEERFILLGHSKKANLLVVCHCHRKSDTIIRIISARKATKSEANQYYDY